MSTPIGDYALLADMRTAALVSRGGSIDWLCLPRFDSPAVFSGILGDEDHGRWLVAARGADVVDWRYEPGAFVASTRWRGPAGEVETLDVMPSADGRADVVRRVTCTAGTATIDVDLRLRPDYGASAPWVRRDRGEDERLVAIAGPDAYTLRGPALTASGRTHRGEFELTAGESLEWVLTWSPSYAEAPAPIDADAALERTRALWRDWSAGMRCVGPWADAVERSLLVLRALTHADTGGIVAAPTTSLPEDPGGVRNWDYRFCWLRDSALTLQAQLAHRGTEAALHWRDWLLRAVAGDPEDLQIMYGIAGERSLPERTLDHLPGYADSVPVRIGNGAVAQFQADVVGEVMIALDELREAGVAEDAFSWPLQRNLLAFVVAHFDQPDQGLWEMRGDPHFFTHSRVMMWAALDRGIRAVERHGLDGPVAEWTALRTRLRDEILTRGVSARTGSFTQTYDNDEVDASLLQIAQTGFVSADDPRMLATVARIEDELMRDGLLLRYRTSAGTDGLAGDEHPFLACSFWLVEQYARSGRRADGAALMDALVATATPLGLLAEEYDPAGGRQIGNFPQAFSHLGLVRAADALAAA